MQHACRVLKRNHTNCSCSVPFVVLAVIVVVVVNVVVQNSLHIPERLHLTTKRTNIKPLCTNDWRKWRDLKTHPVPYGRYITVCP